jgi:hypothetical protein
MLIFCFSGNVAMCDAVRFEYFFSMAQWIGCVQGVNWMIVHLFCVYDVYCTVYVYGTLICNI